MKAYKKIISFILTLVMMLSLSVNVFAAEPLTDDPNMIEWKYTVFADESLQKVVEEGVIPNAYARYTWRGITLKNGEVAILTPSNNSNCGFSVFVYACICCNQSSVNIGFN